MHVYLKGSSQHSDIVSDEQYNIEEFFEKESMNPGLSVYKGKHILFVVELLKIKYLSQILKVCHLHACM